MYWIVILRNPFQAPKPQFLVVKENNISSYYSELILACSRRNIFYIIPFFIVSQQQNLCPFETEARMLPVSVDDDSGTTSSFSKLRPPTHVEIKNTGIRREEAEWYSFLGTVVF